MESFSDHGNYTEDDVAPIISMLRSCELIYTLAAMRSLVNTYDRKFQKSDEESIHFVSPELIITQSQTHETQTHLQSAFIKRIIKPAEMLEFMESNRNLFSFGEEGKIITLRSNEDRNKSPSHFKVLPIEMKLKRLSTQFDAEIWEFDDEYPSSELLFAIIVNRTEQRIICVFRGSVTKKDWKVDLNVCQTTPDIVKEFAKDAHIHKGFANYLFNDDWTSHEQPSKFEQIVDILKEIGTKKDPDGNEYKNYDIYVTGHSLGAALAQLLAFALAGSKLTTNTLPMPITSITFASPRVGDCFFLRAHQSLEKKRSLRHLCISNNGDIICTVPSIGYMQTGLNIHLFQKQPAKLGYSLQRSTLKTLECNRPFRMHSLLTYYERLVANGMNKDLLKKSVEELYKDNVCYEQFDESDTSQLIMKKNSRSKFHQEYLDVQWSINEQLPTKERVCTSQMYRDFLYS